MKIRVQFKDPDWFRDSVLQAVKDDGVLVGADDTEKERIYEARADEVEKELERWVEWGQYVHIDFDTKEGTARVLEKGEW